MLGVVKCCQYNLLSLPLQLLKGHNFSVCSKSILRFAVGRGLKQNAVRSVNLICRSSLVQHARFTNTSSAPLGEETDLYSSIDYDAITKGDADLLKRLKIIILEVEVMRQEGKRVPSKISDLQWSDLLALPGKMQRVKQLSFWAINERKRKNDLRKKEEKKKLKEESKSKYLEERANNDHIQYGFGGSTIFIRVYDSKIDATHNGKLVRAMMFGQNLVVDCGYDDEMTIKEAQNCAKQLTIIFAENRTHRDPYNIHFCNARREGNVISRLHRFIPTMFDDAFPMNITEKSYLDIFPKEKLVYLTPHCKEELTTYNHDDIYIIGALVDKTNMAPLSLAKAKKEGLRMAKLPLDRYLSWQVGTKSLTLNQVMSVMLDLKVTGDWEKALVHVPRRKISSPQEPVGNCYRKRRQDFNARFGVR